MELYRPNRSATRMAESPTPPNAASWGASMENNDGLEVLLFETSPYGNVDAIVQHDGRSICFYLNGRAFASDQPTRWTSSEPSFTTKACWVRNLQLGPYVINEADLQSGRPAMLPRTHMKSPAPGRLPSPENLQIVWFEEGNGAALIETATESRPADRPITLAVIPPWSGIDGFHGYAAESAAESPLCSPMPDHPRLQHRIDRAAEFWSMFSRPPDPFVELRAELLTAYEQHFFRDPSGTKIEPNYFTIAGSHFPPRGLVHYATSTRHLLATVAMSMCPQPMIELSETDPRQFRRIELAIELDGPATPAEIENAKNNLARLAAYPWQRFRWYGAGHTCQFAGVFSETQTAVLIPDAQRNPTNALLLPNFRDDPIRLLWLVPHSPV